MKHIKQIRICLKFMTLCFFICINSTVINAIESKSRVLIVIGTYVNSDGNNSAEIDAVTSATRSINGSYTGSTFEIANNIKSCLEKFEYSVDLYTAERKDIDLINYDLIIIGSAIQGGIPNENIKKFIKSNYEILNQKKIAVFAVCASILSENEKKQRLAKSFSDSVACGLVTSHKKVLAGYIPDLGRFSTKLTKLFLGVNNYETGNYIDQKEVESWAISLVEELK